MGNIQSTNNGTPPFWFEWFDYYGRNVPNRMFNRWLIPTTEFSLNLLRKYFEQYRHYLKNNPMFVSEIESALYWISYLLATTRFHNSRVISELLYSCSSLLTLFNDNLLRNSYHLNKNCNYSIIKFHTFLQFIEFVQVFVELTALQLYGQYGKWIVISIIEIIKASIRLLLLFYYQQGLTRNNYIGPLNRRKEFQRYQMKKKKKSKNRNQQQNYDDDSSSTSIDEAIVLNEDDNNDQMFGEEENNSNNSIFQNDPSVYQLKGSGRIIRNIDHAPPKEKRMWITPAQTLKLKNLLQKNHRTSPTITQLNQQRLIGELLHILRPVVHLATGAMVGGLNDCWTPYLVSLGLDLVSLRLLQGSSFAQYTLDRNNLLGLINSSINQKGEIMIDDIWNWREQMEIQRRYLSLFMYLLRSPFYDQYTKQRLIRLLSLFANYIPIFGRLVRPFIEFLPEWQQVYFYVWNT